MRNADRIINFPAKAGVKAGEHSNHSGLFFLKEKDKKERDTEKIIEQLLEAGSEYMSIMKVKVKDKYLAKGKQVSAPVAVCPSCEEVYFKKFGDKCPACSGNAPYEMENNQAECT